MGETLQFSEEAKEVIDLIENSKSDLFVTGKAGTGKSTLLNFICSKHKKEIAILAPTGIAALNVNGDTIHSFFKLKPGYELDEASNVRIGNAMINKLNGIQTILIDEVSMIRADILDAIDVLLRRARKNEIPFGGVRILFFGDMYQLPPTLNQNDRDQFYQNYSSPYFFAAHVFQQKDLFTAAFQLKTIELTTVYRQSEPKFIEVLNEIRTGKVSLEELDFINTRTKFDADSLENNPVINLVSTNRMANEINAQKLNEIKSPLINYHATISGSIGKIQPNEVLISVKIGAQVMFINNDSKRKWVNGSIGIVLSQSTRYNKEEEETEETLIVQLENGKKVEVGVYTWEISQYVFKNGSFIREPLGFFTQIPLKLAWAVTIHKSQGKSFNQVAIDLGRGSFAHGQTYVALSRCRTFDGLFLKNEIRESDIIVDDVVNDFFTS